MRRDITLDSLRGLFLAIMTIDHLALPLSSYTIHALGFISAAECFVFLSGYVAGIVYTKLRVIYGKQSLWQAALQRAGMIYLAHISVFLLLLVTGLYSNFFVSAWKLNIYNFADPLLLNKPLLALALGSVLLYQPTFLDVLPLYFILVLLMPFLLEQFIKGRSLMVILASATLWFIAQFGVLGLITSAVAKYLPIHLGAFDILAWQLIFVSGLYLGFLKYQQRDLTSLLSNKLVIISLIIATLLFLLRQDLIAINFLESEAIISKERLGLLRLINFAALVYLVGMLRSKFNKLFEWRWLAGLGQHSLQVFAFHVGLIFLLAPMQISSLPKITSFFVTFLVVLSLAIPAKLHQFYRDYQTVEDTTCSAKA